MKFAYDWAIPTPLRFLLRMGATSSMVVSRISTHCAFRRFLGPSANSIFSAEVSIATVSVGGITPVSESVNSVSAANRNCLKLGSYIVHPSQILLIAIFGEDPMYLLVFAATHPCGIKKFLTGLL
eukprot:Gregarina_sp_Poly_1__1449@NODE_1361_length_4294_cov_148_342796_g911_i0_p5_GENE_NODE_1361_length_4294_cov_148_342796_g911_i0NODE_1361_length_4294_cov_148_342796_g911_i0_p5_ORF_typecomplete_len125_score8_38DUF3480/PF11979_8/0_16_NODE_1361_length_4294_cov_148_342796_g911_i0339713